MKAKMVCEKALAGKSRENPKIFCKYINGKRITRERIGPIRDKGGNLWVEPEDIGRENEDDGMEFRQTARFLSKLT